jgi:chromosome segregation ATPase
MPRPTLLLALVAPLILVVGVARAADPEVEQLREQLRATVLQLRELQDQQAQAAAPAAKPEPDQAAAKAKLAATEAQLRKARRAAAQTAAAQAALAKAQADNTALTSAASASAAELEKFKAAYAQSEETDRALGLERDGLKAQLARMNNIAAACQAKNVRLVSFAEEMLSAYRKVGFGQVVAAREPFLGLKRVQLENIAQEREDKVRAAKCDPRLDAAAPAKPAGG